MRHAPLAPKRDSTTASIENEKDLEVMKMTSLYLTSGGEMDVSNLESTQLRVATETVSPLKPESGIDLGGEKLLNTVASLTGLPAPLVHEELGQILELSGQDSANLTLEELRSAMLAYLEKIQDSMVEEGLCPSENEI
jgi:hypothetical protein